MKQYEKKLDKTSEERTGKPCEIRQYENKRRKYDTKRREEENR